MKIVILIFLLLSILTIGCTNDVGVEYRYSCSQYDKNVGTCWFINDSNDTNHILWVPIMGRVR